MIVSGVDSRELNGDIESDLRDFNEDFRSELRDLKGDIGSSREIFTRKVLLLGL